MDDSAPIVSISLSSLPPEVIHLILVHLDVPSLLQTSRTSHYFRALSLDPILQSARLTSAAHSLSYALERRVSKTSISPPQAWIWLSKTNVLSRSISRSLVKIRLSHNLERRPEIEDLVTRGVLPRACLKIGKAGSVTISPIILRQSEEVRKLKLRERLTRMLSRRPNLRELVDLNIIPCECVGGVRGKRGISPRLIDVRRRIIKESLKDGLRKWLEKRAVLEQQKRAEAEDTDKISVRDAVRKLTVKGLKEDEDAEKLVREKKIAQMKWGREAEIARRKAIGPGCLQPTRAHVLGLRRFWESKAVAR